ncbi:MFS transporter [Legionella spiritensis]|uniref:Lysosomal dipeptide transporter MFSD1 n=1 Tax=Legionella spiritensis TaxID=452 RepID=A0A0W0Z7Z9_LEGSP|nr:MFS transporter [Legionella spiritensis]KTD65257.1 hypothetical protein Lspi_0717 [Legionella spiritensis]SNV30251.1 major facilitator family transporter [Legionella spiritensis]
MLKKNSRYLILAWLICGLGAVFYSYEYLLRITPSVMEPSLRAHFNLSATGFGLLLGIYYVAYDFMQIPVGVLLDRYGPRIMLTIACLICVIGTFLFAATDLFWVAATGRFLVGMGSAFAFVGVLKLATIWLPEDKLAMVSGMAAALGTIGAMLGDNLLGIMVIHSGWQQTVNITAVFGVILTVVLWLGIRDRKSYQRQHGTITSFHQSMRDLRIILSNGQIWINGLIGCLVYLPTTVFAEGWGIPYLKYAQGLTQENADLANSLLFLGFTIGAPLMGFISDRIKKRKLPILCGAIAASIVIAIILYVPNIPELTINALLLLLGIFYSVQCIVFAIGRELSPSEAGGTAMAITNMIVMLGALLLQPLVGRLVDFSAFSHISDVQRLALSASKMEQLYSAHDYQFALSIIPVGIILAAVLTYFLKETYADIHDDEIS